jgi:thiamine-phosphate pyrophosphorylase
VLRRARETATMSPSPRLYLITPQIEEPAAFVPQLEQALAAGDVAAVLVRLAPADERTLLARIKAIGASVQRRDVALILDGHPELAGRAGADGAHLFGVEAFVAALALLKPDRIAGIGSLRSRHDAMLAAENGADYVMFGEPGQFTQNGDPPGRRAPADEIEERLTWWADLFEVPCVGYAAGVDEIAALGHTGADFIALGEWIWNEPQGPAGTIAAAAELLAAPA